MTQKISQKISTKLEETAHRVAKELEGSKYRVIYYFPDKNDFECMRIDLVNKNDGKEILVLHQDRYLLNLLIPQKEVQNYVMEIKNKGDSYINSLDKKFSKRITDFLGIYEPFPEPSGALAFASCGLDIKEDELEKITAELIKKYIY